MSPRQGLRLIAVEVSLFPNWVGGQERRRFVFSGPDEVALEARVEDGTPQARTARLWWRRHLPVHESTLEVPASVR